ncbi:MAG: M1 family peptidase, partial [Terracidiphilus sp.]
MKVFPAAIRKNLATVLAILTIGLVSASLARAQRLPQTIRPEHYTLTLAPDLKTATFAGLEMIDVNLAEATDRITLNSAEISFVSVTVNADGREQKAAISLDREREQATFTFPRKLHAGKATLSIVYSGILNDKLRGFYLSKTAKR